MTANDELRKRMAEQVEFVLSQTPEALAAANVRLRELMREMYQCSRQYGCDRCGYKDGCSMFDRMAQLGVEVD